MSIGSSINENELGSRVKPLIQDLAVNPYTQFNSDNVNKLTRIVSNGKNGVVFGLDIRNPKFNTEIISYQDIIPNPNDPSSRPISFAVEPNKPNYNNIFDVDNSIFDDYYDPEDLKLKKNIIRRFDFEFNLTGNPKTITANVDGDNSSIDYPTINNSSNSSIHCKISVFHNFEKNNSSNPPKISLTINRGIDDPYLAYHNKNGNSRIVIFDLTIKVCAVNNDRDNIFEIVKSTSDGNYPSSYVHPSDRLYVTPGIAIKDDVMLHFGNSSSDGNESTIVLDVNQPNSWIHKSSIGLNNSATQTLSIFNNGYLNNPETITDVSISNIESKLVDDFEIPSNTNDRYIFRERTITYQDNDVIITIPENNNASGFGNIRYIVYNNKIVKRIIPTNNQFRISKYIFGDTFNENNLIIYGFKSPCKVSGIKNQYIQKNSQNVDCVKWGYVAIYYKYYKSPDPNKAYIGFITDEEYKNHESDYIILAKLRFISNNIFDIISYENRQSITGLSKLTADRVYYGCLLSPEQRAEWTRTIDGNVPETVYDALNVLRSAVNRLSKNVLKEDSQQNAVVITDEELNLSTRKLHSNQIVTTDDDGLPTTPNEDLRGDSVLITKTNDENKVEVQERKLGKNSLLFTDENGLPTTEGSGIDNITAGDFLYGELNNIDNRVNITAKKIMNLDVLVYADESELNEIKEKAGKKIENGKLTGYYLLSEHPGENLQRFNGTETSVLVSLTDSDAPETIGYGRYTYNPITCRLYYSDRKQNKVIEIQSANIHVGSDTPSNINALWLVPENDDPELQRTEIEDIRKLIFRLGLKVDKLNRLVETGIVPGDTENSYKDELIDYSEFEMPTEFKETDEINSVKIYGPKNCFKDTKYYCIFNPVNTTSNDIQWLLKKGDIFKDHYDFIKKINVSHTIETLVDKTITIENTERKLFSLKSYSEEFYISTSTGDNYSNIIDGVELRSNTANNQKDLEVADGLIYNHDSRKNDLTSAGITQKNNGIYEVTYGTHKYDVVRKEVSGYNEYRSLDTDGNVLMFIQRISDSSNPTSGPLYIANIPVFDGDDIVSYTSTKTIFITDATNVKKSVFTTVLDEKNFAFRYKIESIIPDNYVAGKQYFNGDFCTYNGIQYICTKYIRPAYNGTDAIQFSLDYWKEYNYSQIESIVKIGVNTDLPDNIPESQLEGLNYNYNNTALDEYISTFSDEDKDISIFVRHIDPVTNAEVSDTKKVRISNVNDYTSLEKVVNHICSTSGLYEIGDLFQVKKSNSESAIIKIVQDDNSSLHFRDKNNVVKYFTPEIQEDIQLSIKGPSDCGDGSCYYLDVNKKDLQSNPVWFFIDENDNRTQSMDLFKIDDNNSVKIGTISIEDYDSIVCEISVKFNDNFDYADINNQNITLNCEWNRSLSATKEINISGEKPRTTDMEPTVNAICAKTDTRENIAIAKTNGKLYDGEILFYTDISAGQVPCLCVHYKGKLYPCATKTTEKNGGALSEDDLKTIKLEYLNFKNESSDSTNILHITDNGKIISTRYTDEIRQNFNKPVNNGGDAYINSLLQINSFYLGDSNSESCLCSHNFVELANGSNTDINLDGLYLLYTSGKPIGEGVKWEVLKLKGVIPAESTFLIRGKQCNSFKRSFIKVDSYDLEWRKQSETDIYDSYERNGDLIEFHQGSSAFYLCCDYNSIKDDLESNRLKNRWISIAEPPYGYIDLVGVKLSHPDNVSYSNDHPLYVYQDTPCEKKSIGPKTNLFDPNNLLYTRRFPMDPAKQSNKKYAKKNNDTLWSFIDLSKQTYHGNYSYQYYPDDELKLKYSPKCSMDHKNLYTNKTDFNPKKPNIINMTFGINATSNSSQSQTATRCFNWVSVGYYDEYIEYKKTTDSTWKKIHSIDLNNKSRIISELVSMGRNNITLTGNTLRIYTDYYNKIRWFTPGNQCVTTHKCIIYGLTAGEYQYRIGREYDSLYTSEIRTFKVIDNPTSFTFIQTSDQQGFNWQEYQVWKKCAYIIDQVEKDATKRTFDFTINTGDIAQSGNRPNEWLDYYDGREYLNDTPEMFTIGNNDLCASDSTLNGDGEEYSSKYNHINVLRYFTFEIDVNNVTTYNIDGNDYTYPSCYYFNKDNLKLYPIYSLYSYNYGSYHFICLNSEISKEIYKCYPGEIEGMADKINAQIEEWFKNDINGKDGSHCIVYMHEMPFTMMPIVTCYKELNDKDGNERAGSHLNTLNSNGTYRFSRLFAKNGIKLVIGGHKHTYTLMKPVLDLPLYIGDMTKITGGEYKYFTIDNGIFRLRSSLSDDEKAAAIIDLSTSAKLKSKISDENDLNNMITTSLDSDHMALIPVQYSDTNPSQPIAYKKDTKKFSMHPVIITYGSTTQENNLGRYLNIQSTYTAKTPYLAPTYVMCQATSYKLVSNKELPAPNENWTFNSVSYNTKIPWILSYFPCSYNTNAAEQTLGNDTHSLENMNQHNPMYIVYNVSDKNIEITAKQVRGIFYGSQYKKVGKNYEENNQYDQIGSNAMTFGSAIKSQNEAKVYYEYNLHYTDVSFEPVETVSDNTEAYYSNNVDLTKSSYTIYTKK